jgi:hypothetical protein
LSIFCAIVGHYVSDRIIRNEGTSFSRCIRCSTDLIETEGRWGAPPKGHRVVWEKRPSEAAQLSLPPALEAPAEDYETILELDNRSGADRRAARTARVLTSLRSMERRSGGERRKNLPKRQALDLDRAG